MVGKRKSNALLHIANYGIVRFRMLQIITGDGRRELRRFYMELYPTLALHLRLLPLDLHLACVAKGSNHKELLQIAD
jgi:hypothetical protein